MTPAEVIAAELAAQPAAKRPPSEAASAIIAKELLAAQQPRQLPSSGKQRANEGSSEAATSVQALQTAQTSPAPIPSDEEVLQPAQTSSAPLLGEDAQAAQPAQSPPAPTPGDDSQAAQPAQPSPAPTSSNEQALQPAQSSSAPIPGDERALVVLQAAPATGQLQAGRRAELAQAVRNLEATLDATPLQGTLQCLSSFVHSVESFAKEPDNSTVTGQMDSVESMLKSDAEAQVDAGHASTENASKERATAWAAIDNHIAELMKVDRVAQRQEIAEQLEQRNLEGPEKERPLEDLATTWAAVDAYIATLMDSPAAEAPAAAGEGDGSKDLEEPLVLTLEEQAPTLLEEQEPQAKALVKAPEWSIPVWMLIVAIVSGGVSIFWTLLAAWNLIYAKLLCIVAIACLQMGYTVPIYSVCRPGASSCFLVLVWFISCLIWAPCLVINQLQVSAGGLSSPITIVDPLLSYGVIPLLCFIRAKPVPEEYRRTWLQGLPEMMVAAFGVCVTFAGNFLWVISQAAYVIPLFVLVYTKIRDRSCGHIPPGYNMAFAMLVVMAHQIPFTLAILFRSVVPNDGGDSATSGIWLLVYNFGLKGITAVGTAMFSLGISELLPRARSFSKADWCAFSFSFVLVKELLIIGLFLDIPALSASFFVVLLGNMAADVFLKGSVSPTCTWLLARLINRGGGPIKVLKRTCCGRCLLKCMRGCTKCCSVLSLGTRDAKLPSKGAGQEEAEVDGNVSHSISGLSALAKGAAEELMDRQCEQDARQPDQNVEAEEEKLLTPHEERVQRGTFTAMMVLADRTKAVTILAKLSALICFLTVISTESLVFEGLNKPSCCRRIDPDDRAEAAWAKEHYMLRACKSDGEEDWFAILRLPESQQCPRITSIFSQDARVTMLISFALQVVSFLISSALGSYVQRRVFAWAQKKANLWQTEEEKALEQLHRISTRQHLYRNRWYILAMLPYMLLFNLNLLFLGLYNQSPLKMEDLSAPYTYDQNGACQESRCQAFETWTSMFNRTQAE
eukprot:TRINITY_DN48854_c0_g1_i1.p1 TRINITY_DN48854_c0_g1~~TRINITY_DN48854_c0_g1_i1.p1  ORF type:complete len:1018 (-),score=204.58 TRINITY_DN48854_c0_g1_i1:51-3104(-)